MRLDPRAKLLWRLTGALQALPILLGGALGSYVLSSRAPFYFAVLPLLGAVALRDTAFRGRPAAGARARHADAGADGTGATRGYPARTSAASPGALDGRFLHGSGSERDPAARQRYGRRGARPDRRTDSNRR